MHSTSVSSVIPLAQVSNSFFRKKKIPKKKKKPRIDPTTMVKMKMDALITLELTLVKADG